MKYREVGGRLLLGTNQQAALLGVGVGVLLTVAVWLLHSIIGVQYWLGPHSLIDWVFVIGFVLVTAVVAFHRSGLLVAIWVSFPAHILLAQYQFSHGFVVLPFQNDLLSYIYISAVIAGSYGLVGYLLGTVSRRTIGR